MVPFIPVLGGGVKVDLGGDLGPGLLMLWLERRGDKEFLHIFSLGCVLGQD